MVFVFPGLKVACFASLLTSYMSAWHPPLKLCLASLYLTGLSCLTGVEPSLEASEQAESTIEENLNSNLPDPASSDKQTLTNPPKENTKKPHNTASAKTATSPQKELQPTPAVSQISKPLNRPRPTPVPADLAIANSQRNLEQKNSDGFSANKQKSTETATLHRPSPSTKSNVGRGSTSSEKSHGQSDHSHLKTHTANVNLGVKGQSTGSPAKEDLQRGLGLSRAHEANDDTKGNPVSTMQSTSQKQASLNTDRGTGIQNPPGFTKSGSGAQRNGNLTEYEANIHQIESRAPHGFSTVPDQAAPRMDKNDYFQRDRQYTPEPQRRVPYMPNDANQQQSRDIGILGRRPTDSLERQAAHMRPPPGFRGNR